MGGLVLPGERGKVTGETTTATGKLGPRGSDDRCRQSRPCACLALSRGSSCCAILRRRRRRPRRDSRCDRGPIRPSRDKRYEFRWELESGSWRNANWIVGLIGFGEVCPHEEEEEGDFRAADWSREANDRAS